MKKILAIAAISEGLTGVILFVYPPIVIRVLFDTQIEGVGVFVSRIFGISLIALGISCWPDRNPVRAFFGMFAYSLLATLFLTYVGVTSSPGILLWPAVAAHVLLSVLLFWAWRKDRQALEAST